MLASKTSCVLATLAPVLLAHAAPPSPSPTRTVRVAAISYVPVKFGLQENADRLAGLFRQAHLGGAQIAVGPEGALDGYVVNEIIAGEVPAERMKEVAVAIDGPMIQRFRQLARELKMSLVFGFAEQRGDDVFNSAVFIDHRGEICGTYQKMQFAEGYHPSWWFNRLGAHSRAFDTPYGRCGMMICNDRWNPLLARITALDGAQFLVIPAFGSRSKAQDEAVLSRGQEIELPVVEANVGVSLVVDRGKIATVRRAEEGIAFSQITIPPPRRVQREERDRTEREFLAWRAAEMSNRYQKTMKRNAERKSRSPR